MIVDSSAKLKALQVRRTTAKKELEEAKKEKEKLKEDWKKEDDKVNQKIKGIEISLSCVNKELEDFDKKTVERGTLSVSEHALLRYLERVYKIDIEAVKKEILTDEVVSNFKGIGPGKFPHKSGKVMIRGNTVVTFEPLESN